MTIQKFKTLPEAEEAQWNFNPDKQYYEKVRELFRLATKINPPNFPQGVFKYKTLEDANRQKMEWIVEAALKKNVCK